MKQIPEVSFINPGDPLWRRILMRVVELMTGQPKLQRLYDDYKRTRSEDDNFWESAVEYLNVDIHYDRAQLDALPKEGPLIVVANHPFGVLDGIAIGYILSRVRPDIKILAHSVLGRAEPLRPYLIPILFEGENGALRANVESKRIAMQHLGNNGTIIIFPAGRVSTAEKIFGEATDSPWKLFAGRLITHSNATVVPIFFEGQNSWVFHFVSKFSASIREAVLLREVLKQIGTKVVSHIGAPIDPASLTEIGDRQAILDYLREAVYDLDPNGAPVLSPSP
ncbi:MAG: lysophospholipid acyltransferase family protein [Pseudomonadota bacterium]|nr:lysophospholipid acyltransferase family protein [Pseudomonadota bacterium]